MHLEKYTAVKGDSDFYYEFYSEGPKGRIRKIVRLMSLTEYGNDYYNLYLGDWLEAEDRFSDTVVSNNMDREKILATVAAIVVDFTAAIPHAVIFAEGNTALRNRLYQMGISANWRDFRKIGITSRSCCAGNKIVILNQQSHCYG